MKPPPKYSPTEALQKMRKYCAYQERCHQEVKQKLYSWYLYGSDIDQITTQLIEEGFLNEERFAKAIAGGKFRQKGWGKQKIVNTLKQKGISTYLISTSLKEIEPDDYKIKLRQILEKKKALLKVENPMTQKQKLFKFAMSKGYESDLIWEELNLIFDPEHSG